MLRGLKVRIYPTEEMKTEINKLLGCSRFVYNYALGLRGEHYRAEGKTLSLQSLSEAVINLKNTEDHLWLADAHSKVIQQSLLDLNTAFKRFFDKKSKYPNFKCKNVNEDSCRFPVDAISGIKGNRILLTQKIKNILYKCSWRDEKRLNKYRNEIRSATLSKEKSGKYFVSFLIDMPLDKELPEVQQTTGADIGIKDFVVTAQGKRFPNLNIAKKKQKS